MARALTLILASLLAPVLALAPAMAQPRPGPTVRTVTAASDTILNTDCGNVVRFNRASAVAVTLPQAASGGNFNVRCQIQFVNIGAGNATITPTTSQIDGRASIVLQQGGGLVVTSSGGQWVSGGIFPALSTSGIVDSDQLPTATDTVKGGIIAGTCISMGGTGNKTASVATQCRERAYGFSFGDGISVASTGIVGSFTVKNACTIVAWSLVFTKFDSGSTTTAALDMWVSTSAVPTVSNTIMGTKPSLSAAARSGVVTTGISGWTAAGVLSANSEVVVNLDSNNHGTLGTFMFWCRES